ncbi:UvrD-helicase domain-containing protein [Pedobacter suwonensis]|uniref:UvrD-helicase domain-containing protein n=1 Tax=Pedobacter suwonensis TaxID=332999 RepID=UPI00119F945E|nr:UvrD-helicase domain-containing protein [Pedobacter suwonensis]
MQVEQADIDFAETVLFGSTGHFDKERLDFIRDFTTLDLQAVPGSGKTTVLLAKLLVLERHLPLPYGEGVLILSHTNVAVEEIASKIAIHCPKLFSYPNFLGTIQSFVNQFLAAPFYEQVYRSSIVRIDNEIYDQVFLQNLNLCLPKKSKPTHNKILHIRGANVDQLLCYRFDKDDKETYLVKELNGDKLEVNKPRGNTKKDNYRDWTKEEKKLVLDYLFALKTRCLKNGILHFDDAYFLAKSYLLRVPSVSGLLRLRFPYVFVDEMQDMEIHQHDILEQLFFGEGIKNCFQRIGDINQCIFGSSSKSSEIWNTRKKALTLVGSHRLKPKLASILSAFGAKMQVDVLGFRMGVDLGPHLIVFEKKSIANVIPKFAELVLTFLADGKISSESVHPIKVVGWNGKESDDGKLRIKDYFPGYSAAESKLRIDHLSLFDYLVLSGNKAHTFSSLRKNILNGILKILRLQSNLPPDPYSTKRKFVRYIKFNFPGIYQRFLSVLYLACSDCLRQKPLDAHKKLVGFLPGMFAEIFQVTLEEKAAEFLGEQVSSAIKDEPKPVHNRIVYKDIELQVGTVHSVKGETHLATLYLDTCYYDLESVKSCAQLTGKDACKESGIRKKESATMMYVGFSRATDLLCYAVPEGNLDHSIDQMRELGWTIIKI